ncbi:MAG: nucleotidyltransferase family protein, partial [Bacteroidaceae bacterium]|nr:nucleotidyltransferase family protein [Bacteroidaceae bacterium]
MSQNRNCFFELLQVALGSRERLSRVPTSDEWEEIYEESGRQAVTGILLHGIDRLPVEQRPSQMFLLQWIGEGQIIEQQNLMMDKRCVLLLKKLDEYGLHGSILKGQGISLLYDKELRPLRQSGDIDVYVDCGLKGALEFAKSTGQKEVEWDYKHLHLNVWDDTEIEMHYRVEVLLNLWKSRKLQCWFKEHEKDIFNLNGNLDLNSNTNISSEHKLPLIDHELSNKASSNTDGADRTDGMTTPTVEFNVFYILLHIYRHFLYEGVGFRQIVDYYYVLRTIQVSGSKIQEYIDAVRVFGMEKFAKGLMWVMKVVLGMPDEWMLWEPGQKEGEYILKQVMEGGNFGHYDERLNHGGGKLGAVKAILTHNLHLL